MQVFAARPLETLELLLYLSAMQSFIFSMQKLARRLSRADMVFYSMPPLIILLLVGTIAQKYIGLYAAHKMFFSSFIVWLGPVPFPGGYLVIGTITVFLSLKFLFYSKWSWAKAGIHLTHLGVLILLAGGLLTAIYAREGYMIIPEGAQSPYVYDYVDRELLVAEGDETRVILFEDIKAGIDLGLPFSARVLSACQNCDIEKREESQQDFGDKPMRAFAQFMALERKALEKIPEENLSGFTFEISGTIEDQDGIYIAFEAMPKPIEITYKKKDYQLIFGKAQRALPFSVKLIDFKKHTYPGMNKARDYSSDIIISDGGVEWPVRIEMNEPFRYKGYTFYQSSFEQSSEGERTILSVVENRGRLFPYIGTLVVAIGLLFHLIIVLRRREGR